MLTTRNNMEQTIRLGVPYPTAFGHRVKRWWRCRNEWYSQICGYRVTNGMAVRNGLLMPLCGVLAIGMAETSLIGALLLGAATLALAWNLFNDAEKERR